MSLLFAGGESLLQQTGGVKRGVSGRLKERPATSISRSHPYKEASRCGRRRSRIQLDSESHLLTQRTRRSHLVLIAATYFSRFFNCAKVSSDGMCGPCSWPALRRTPHGMVTMATICEREEATMSSILAMGDPGLEVAVGTLQIAA